MGNFNPKTKVLFVTDCFQHGSVRDLCRREFGSRPICHISSVKEHGGDAFVSSLLETINMFVKSKDREFSVASLYNRCFTNYSHCFQCNIGGSALATVFSQSPDR